MAGGFEEKAQWSEDILCCDGETLEAFFASDAGMGNTWQSALEGFDSCHRNVEARDANANFYMDEDAILENDARYDSFVKTVNSQKKKGVAAGRVDVGASVISSAVAGPSEGPVQITTVFIDEGMAKTTADADVIDGGFNGDPDKQLDVAGVGHAAKLSFQAESWDAKMDELTNVFAYLRVMKEYTSTLQDTVYNISVAACMDGSIRASVGPLIPAELFEVARKNLLDVNGQACNNGCDLRGLIVPATLEILFDSVGVTCHEKQTGGSVSVGACMSPNCSNNRYRSPSFDHIWKFYSWVESEATDDELSQCWYSNGVQGVMALSGVDFKQYLAGKELSVVMFAAFTSVLRLLESYAYNMGKRVKTIHYVDHQWATMATSGLLAGGTSIKLFLNSSLTFLLSPSSVVMAPICFQGKWFCYSIDFQDKMVSVMDPYVGRMTTKDFDIHLKNSGIILKECVRCMREIVGNELVGHGEWRGTLLLGKRSGGDSVFRKDAVGCVLSCMMGFNADHVCDKYDDVANRGWMRRKMVYSLLHMSGSDLVEGVLGRKTGTPAASDRASVTGGHSG